MMNQLRHNDGYHKPAPHGPGAVSPNEHKYNGYVLLFWTRPDLHIEPDILGEISRATTPRSTPTRSFSRRWA
jgi:hypothetical protein